MRELSFFIILCCLCLACRPSPAPEAQLTVRDDTDTAKEIETMDPRDEVDPYAPTYGPTVEVEALYLVEPVPGGKRLQATLLRLDDGREWIRSYRPVPDELEFFEKRVIAKGRTYTPSPMVQHVMGTHFEVESIRLAPSELAHDPVPTKVPSPPLARTLAEIGARDLRWVQVHGTLDALEVDPKNTFWADGKVTLKEGEKITLSGLSASKNQAFVGKEVTAVGRSLGGQVSGKIVLCAGHVLNCGAPRPRGGTKSKPGKFKE